MRSQRVKYDIPLKNWPAPLYWQPSQADTEAAGGKASPELRTPTAQASTVSGPLVFVAMTPCRVVDTRASYMFPSPFGPPSLSSGPARSFPIQSSTLCTIPSTAQAYSFNVTLVPPGPVGYLTLWPTGQSQPVVVTLDDVQGQIVNNAAIVPAGTPNGSISAVVSATTDLVIDINGYYVAINAIDLGNDNTAIGLNALINTNSSSIANTASGSYSLYSNTSGAANTASGFDALYSNTTGSDNTASGIKALLSNTTGNNNSAYGAFALQNNTTGSGNTATGYGALLSNTFGAANTASGLGALQNNTNGDYNSASGYQALFSNTTGPNNTASGYQALYNNTGGDNTASGYQALYSNTTGAWQHRQRGGRALQQHHWGLQHRQRVSGALQQHRI